MVTDGFALLIFRTKKEQKDSGGRWTWPTPLKSPSSKSKSPSLGDLDLDEGDLS